MEQAKKHLKTSSFVVLLFAVLSLVEIVTELLFFEVSPDQIPAGAPDNILLITKMVLLGVSMVFLLPKIYVGVKGLKIAKNPDTSKKHITWAIIIFVFAVLGMIEPIISMVKQGFNFDTFSVMANSLLEATIYFDFIAHAKKVAKLAE